MWMLAAPSQDEYGDTHYFMFEDAEKMLEFAHEVSTNPEAYKRVGKPDSLELFNIAPSEFYDCDGEWCDGDTLFARWDCIPAKSCL